MKADNLDELDRTWAAYHDGCMDVFRRAFGMPDGTIPDMIAELDRLRAEVRRLAGLARGETPAEGPRDLLADFEALRDAGGSDWDEIADPAEFLGRDEEG